MYNFFYLFIYYFFSWNTSGLLYISDLTIPNNISIVYQVFDIMLI